MSLADSIANYEYSDAQKAWEFLNELEVYINKSGSELEKAKFHIYSGWLHEDQSNFKSAKKHYETALEIYKSEDNLQGQADATGNIANIYDQLGLIEQAMDYQQLSLMYNEKILLIEKEDSSVIKRALAGKSAAFTNLGALYYSLKEYQKAYDHLLLAYQIDSTLNDVTGMSICLSSLGIYARNLGQKEKALAYYLEAERLYLQDNNLYNLYHLYSNMGNLYTDLGELDKAIASFKKSQELADNIGEKKQLTYIYNGLADIYRIKKEYQKAEDLYKQSLALSYQMESLERISNTSQFIADLYAELKDFEKAHYYRKQAMEYRDSMHNEINYRGMGQAEVKYQFQLESMKDSIAFEQEREQNAKEKALQNEQIKKQQYIIYLSVASALLLIFVAILAYRSYLTKKKSNSIILQQKEEVEFQKQMVEEKNEEILDSISYAKRIQEAILPPIKGIQNSFKDSFVLYLPKDIVAGDFYYFNEVEGYKVIAAADCTGHGVPGALVSVICHNALERSIKEFGLRDAGEILNKTRELVIDTFAKSSHDVKDGMDIALCSVKDHKLTFSGAHNPLWIVRNNDIIEFKGDKQPIGKFEGIKDFFTHSVELMKNDTLYLFTDGFADQFGGEKGKKYKYNKFKRKLIEIHQLPMYKQHEIMEEEFNNWRQNLEQLDDICIIGLSI